MFHYLEIPVAKRKNFTWNNLGVARERLKLKIMSIDAYRKAEELGSTLAMSNLAQEFISAGFSKEADALCTSALAKPDYDPRVLETLTRLKTETKEESEKEDELVKKVWPRVRFLRNAGHSLTLPLSTALAAQWAGPNCTLTISIEHDKVALRGAYEVEATDLTAIAYSPRIPQRYTISYEGKIRGCVFFVKFLRRQVGDTTATSLLTERKPESAVMILSNDGRKLEVMERIGSNHKFYSIDALGAE